jgi:acylphosphatase
VDHGAVTNQRVRVLYRGTVQGVGFRWRAADAARGIAVTGYVKNLPDGRVELVAEGVREDVERLLDTVRSRMASLIEGEDAAWERASGEFPRFSVVR